MTKIPLGAVNKKTGEYVYPIIANKIDDYSCPDCHKDLILCQGNIRLHHFRHKIDEINPCHHYNNPTESQIHKDAKMLMKTLLEKNVNISFIRNCQTCKKNDEFEIPTITDTSSIQLEHKFDYNGTKIADVVYIDNGEIICIFEICHTHKTDKEKRPEPWFEIDALSLINLANDMNNNSLKINCIRCEKCDECLLQINNENSYIKDKDFICSNKCKPKNCPTKYCKGFGECLLQTKNLNSYIKDKDFICSNKCKPKNCPTKYCNNVAPQWLFDYRRGTCLNCDSNRYSLTIKR